MRDQLQKRDSSPQWEEPWRQWTGPLRGFSEHEPTCGSIILKAEALVIALDLKGAGSFSSGAACSFRRDLSHRTCCWRWGLASSNAREPVYVSAWASRTTQEDIDFAIKVDTGKQWGPPCARSRRHTNKQDRGMNQGPVSEPKNSLFRIALS